MADYYIDVSQAFNGDGTSSAAASVDGGVGAANSFIEVSTGVHATIGVLAGGDNVYIRTADGSGDLSETLTATTTVNTTASDASRVTFIFDKGVKWAESGVFILVFGTAATPRTFTWDRGVDVDADGANHRLKLKTVNTGNSNNWCKFVGQSDYSGVEVDFTGGGLVYGGSWNVSSETTNNFYNFKFTTTVMRTNFGGYAALGSTGNSCVVNHTDMEIDYTTNVSSIADVIFDTFGYRGVLNINGLKITNAIAGMLVVKAGSGNAAHTVNISNINRLSNYGAIFNKTILDVSKSNLTKYSALGGENLYDYEVFNDYCMVDFVDNDSFPFLNATLPDGRGWSLRVDPLRASLNHVAKTPPVRKLYNAASSIRTIDLELQLLATETEYDTSNLWIDVTYVDDVTGVVKFISSKAIIGLSLASGSSGWSANTFGVDSYTPLKLAITTPTSVKKDSYITAVLCSNLSKPDDSYMFYCPDVVIT